MTTFTTSIPLLANLAHVANEVYHFEYAERITATAEWKNTDLTVPCTVSIQQNTFSDYGVVVVTGRDNVGDEYTSAPYALNVWENMDDDTPITLVSDDDHYSYVNINRSNFWAPAQRQAGGSK